MLDPKLRKILDELHDREPRFSIETFLFVSEALTETAKKLGRADKKTVRERHISGQELSEGLAECAKEKFGSLAYPVLRELGIESTRDIGDLVFLLIDAGIFSKTPQDSIEDFDNVFDLRERLKKV